MWKWISMVACGLLLLAPDAMAGWCKAEAPVNACGPCKRDAVCGNMKSSCWAQRSGACDRANTKPQSSDLGWRAMVPPSWSVEERIEHDFNRDKRVDLAMVIRTPENDPRDNQGPDRLLIVALRDKRGLQQVVHTACVALCQHCGGMMGDPFIGMKLNRAGSIVVANSGGSGAGHWTRNFTLGWHKGRMAVIGFDESWRDNFEPEQSDAVSINLLSGKLHIRSVGGLRPHPFRPVAPSDCRGLENLERHAAGL